MEQEAGVGVVVTEKDITETVKTVLDENRCQVETKGLVRFCWFLLAYKVPFHRIGIVPMLDYW